MLDRISKIKLPILKVIFYISLLIIAFNSLAYLYEKFILGDRELFHDLVLNYCAGILYSKGISPYGFGLGKTPLIDCVINVTGSDWGMPAYFYSTFYLKILGLLSNFKYSTIYNLWFLSSIVSFILILVFTNKVFYELKIKWGLIVIPILIFFSFGGILIKAFTSGNLSVVVYGFLALSLIFLHKNYKIFFCFMIILISLIKPHHLIYLIIGILVYEKEFIKYFLASSLIVLIIFFLEFNFNKELFLGYLSNLHASTTPEFFFSYNANVGLKDIINNLPTNIGEQLNYYILAGPNFIKNLVWIVLTILIIIGSIIYRTSLKIKNLDSKKKSSLIALGCIVITIINPNLAVYEFYLFVPSIFFLINRIQWSKIISINQKIKYLIFTSFVIVQDINFPFFCATLIFFYIIFNNYKKKEILI